MSICSIPDSQSKNVAKRVEPATDLTAKINKWQTVDSVIFEEANRTLWEKVEEFGIERMTLEKKALERRNQQLSEEWGSYLANFSVPNRIDKRCIT